MFAGHETLLVTFPLILGLVVWPVVWLRLYFRFPFNRRCIEQRIHLSWLVNILAGLSIDGTGCLVRIVMRHLPFQVRGTEVTGKLTLTIGKRRELERTNPLLANCRPHINYISTERRMNVPRPYRFEVGSPVVLPFTELLIG